MSQAEARRTVLAGGCQCGAVRYALFAEPEETSVCHCRMCQKAVGGPFAVFTTVRNADMIWTHGKPATFASSTAAERDFCAACGTPLTFRYLATDRTGIASGSLDAPVRAPPSIAYGIESRLSWLGTLDALPARATDDDPPDYVRSMTNFQHPDHETPPGWRPAPAG